MPRSEKTECLVGRSDFVVQEHLSELRRVNIRGVIVGPVVSSDRVWAPSSACFRTLSIRRRCCVFNLPHHSTPASACIKSSTHWEVTRYGSCETSPMKTKRKAIGNKSGETLRLREGTSHGAEGEGVERVGGIIVVCSAAKAILQVEEWRTLPQQPPPSPLLRSSLSRSVGKDQIRVYAFYL